MSSVCSRSKKRREACTRLTPGAMFNSASTAPESCSSQAELKSASDGVQKAVSTPSEILTG